MPKTAVSPPSPFFFKTPFTPGFWRCAFRELKNPRTLVVAALFIALEIVVSSLFIPVGENLRIYFSFFVKSLGAMIYGPVVGLLTGLVSDLLGYMLRPDPPFFPGYMLTSMMSAFLYGLFLYRAPRIGVVRILCNCFLVVVICNLGLNCLWSAILYGKGYYYYLASSLVKNALVFPVQIILLILFLRLMIPILERAGFRPKLPPVKAAAAV